MGLIGVRRAIAPELVDVYRSLDPGAHYDGRDRANMYMTSFLQHLIDDVTPVAAVVVDGGWLEVDTIADLETYEALTRDGRLRDYCAARASLSVALVEGARAGRKGFEKLPLRAAGDHVLRRGRRLVAALRAHRARADRDHGPRDLLPHVERRRPDPAHATTQRIHAFEIGEGFEPCVPVPDHGGRRAGRDGAPARHQGAPAVEARRSDRNDYVYVFHSMVSTHMIYEPDGFDHYDTVLLCRGRTWSTRSAAREELYGLPAKELVEHGYGRLDAILATRRDPSPDAGRRTAGRAHRTVVGPDVHLRDVRRAKSCAALLDAGYEVIARPHPMTAKKTPKAIAGARRRSSPATRASPSTPTSRRRTRSTAPTSW